MRGITTIRNSLWPAVATAAALAVAVAAQPPPVTSSAPTSRPAELGLDVLAPDAAGMDDIKLLNLEVPTIITGARHRQTIATAPYAVSVITAKDIRESGARSIPDALRLVPGVDVAELLYNAVAVSPRGLNRFLSSHVLVLVDGRQIYDSMFGGTEWGIWPFQLEDIERIEVIRGTGGVTWGTNAINGVINVVTRDPVDQKGLTFTGGGGSRGATKEHLGYGYADEKLRLRVSGEYESSDGFARGGSRLWPLRDDLKAGRTGVHAIYDAGPQDTLTFSGGSGVQDGGFSRAPLNGFRTDRNPGTQANYLMGQWSHLVEQDNAFHVVGYFNDLWLTTGCGVADFRYQQFALQFSHTLKPAPDHTLTWGIDTRADLVDGSYADPSIMTRNFVSTGIFGLYVQDEWRFAPRWALNLGARLDYEFYNGFQPSGRAALSYELAKDSLVYAAVSDAFMMPAVGDRFQDEAAANGLIHLVSHRDLESTTAIVYELGHRGRYFDKLETNLDLYWNEYRDWCTIAMKPGPPGLLRMDYDNRAALSTYGVELGAKYRPLKNLTLLGNYTMEQLNWRGDMSPAVEGDINTPPRHKFMLGARYSPIPDLHLSSHLYFVDDVTAPNPTIALFPRHIPHYFRLDLRAEYEFWKKQASVAVGVRNLLDPSHREGGTLLLNDAEVPRMIYAELRLTIR